MKITSKHGTGILKGDWQTFHSFLSSKEGGQFPLSLSLVQFFPLSLFGPPSLAFNRKRQCSWIIESGYFSRMPIVSLFFISPTPSFLSKQTNKNWNKKQMLLSVTHASFWDWFQEFIELLPRSHCCLKKKNTREEWRERKWLVDYFCVALKITGVFSPFLKA